MENNNTIILEKIKKSFNVILEMLRYRDVPDLEDISADNFTDFFTSQINNNTSVITINNTYKIIYNIEKRPSFNNIEEALYNGHGKGGNIYTHNIILVLQNRLQSKEIKKLEKLKLNMQIFMLRELQYNITKHYLVPKHELIKNPDDVKKVLEDFSLHSISQLPLILQTDPMAKWLYAQPGDVIKITRPSESAGSYTIYRCCV